MFGFGKSSAVKTMSPPEVQAAMKAGQIRLVDVREANEWAQARIPGAVHAPLSQLPQALANVPKDKPLVLHCLSGARSARAIGLCAAAGVDTHMAGGISAWMANGLPVTR